MKSSPPIGFGFAKSTGNLAQPVIFFEEAPDILYLHRTEWLGPLFIAPQGIRRGRVYYPDRRTVAGFGAGARKAWFR